MYRPVQVDTKTSPASRVGSSDVPTGVGSGSKWMKNVLSAMWEGVVMGRRGLAWLQFVGSLALAGECFYFHAYRKPHNGGDLWAGCFMVLGAVLCLGLLWWDGRIPEAEDR